MPSQKKPSAAARPQDRPPAEQVAKDLYRQQFGTSKPDAELPTVSIDPDQPVAGIDHNASHDPEAEAPRKED